MKEVPAQVSILQTKPHFAILDGLRGVAAIAIVVFHFMEWVITDISKNFIGHGFLAVDFFFCLSGFVIGYAYDDRLKQLGIRQFFISRLIRLQPLVIIGTLLGLLAFFIDPFSSAASEYNIGTILLIVTCSLLLIPLPIMEERAFNLFGLNAPSWSLFWEYVANILYALILCRLSRRVLAVITVAAAVTLFMVSYRAGNLLGGWSKDNFWDGGARLAFSFSAGLLIHRYHFIIKNRLGFPALSVLLLLAFVIPWNWLGEALVVILYFPLLVALGAGSSLSESTKKICKFSGDLSYPLYMTHYVAIWIFGNYFTTQQPSTTELTLVISAGTVLLVLLGWATMKWVDIPVRKYLSQLRKRNWGR